MGERVLPPEDGVASPGVVAVVDDRGVLRDRSPRAADDALLGRVELGAPLPGAREGDAPVSRRRLHDASPLEALWFARGEPEVRSGLGERDFATMLYRLRNQLGVVLASMETADLAGDGPVSSRLGHTQRREVERLVEGAHALGHAFGPAGGRGPLDLDFVVRRAVDTARGRARRRGISLRPSLGSEARRPFAGDAGLLQAAVDALVTNAVDASVDGAEIRLAVEAGPASLTLRIHDDGPGLLAPEGGRPEAPFASVRKGALGVGLSIALRAAATHLGELWVGSRLEGGTTARLWIPVPPAT